MPDRYGRIPLHRAALNGHERVVKMLLYPGGSNPNRTYNDSQALLVWAALNGQEEVVKMLLG